MPYTHLSTVVLSDRASYLNMTSSVSFHLPMISSLSTSAVRTTLIISYLRHPTLGVLLYWPSINSFVTYDVLIYDTMWHLWQHPNLRHSQVSTMIFYDTTLIFKGTFIYLLWYCDLFFNNRFMSSLLPLLNCRCPTHHQEFVLLHITQGSSSRDVSSWSR